MEILKNTKEYLFIQDYINHSRLHCLGRYDDDNVDMYTIEKYIKENKIKRLTLTEKENLSEKYNYPLDERYNYILNKILDEENYLYLKKTIIS